MAPSQHPTNVPVRDLKWSRTEKLIARRAFDLALGRELEDVIRETKDRAARIKEAAELWELESWLSERRRDIDRRYDYRYSVLPLVFSCLVRDGHLSEDELSGLGPDKLESIRRH